MEVTVRVKRYNPENDRKPWWDEHTLDMEETDRVLDALHEIKYYRDGTLAVRRSCAHGVCGSDAVRVNGVNRLACKVLLRDVAPTVTVEPILGLPVIKDLVVDMEPFMAQYRSVMPWLINDESPPAQERHQTEEQRARFDDTTKCILCAACTTACPSFWARGEYVGPAAIVQAHRFIFDSRDRGAAQRLEIMNEPDGVWRCRTIFNCTTACPRDIQITEAIADVKKALLFSRL